MLTAVVIGCGPRGLDHIRAILDLEGVHLAGTADPDPDCRAAARHLGVPAFASAEELLAHTRPHLVVVATPPAHRLTLCQTAASQPGVKAILLEKPIALSLSDADRMLAVCREKGVLLAVGHHWRYCPELMALKAKLDADGLGAVRFIHGVSYGNLLDQGDHLLDAALWLTGAGRVRWAMSQACDDPAVLAPLLGPGRRYWHDPDHPAPMWMTHHLELDDGTRVILESGLLQRRLDDTDDWHQRRLVVVGSRSSVECRPGGDDVGRGMTLATRALLADVRDAVCDGREPLCAAEPARRVLEGLLLCLRSARDGTLATPALLESPSAVPVLPATGLRFSVIVPLVEHRGRAPESIAAWAGRQSLPRAEYEVIVVDDGTNQRLGRSVEKLLRPGDRFLSESGANRSRLYDLGARDARGEFVFLTESHCVPDKDCLAELDRFFREHAFDGACCRSVGVAETFQDRLDLEMFEEGFDQFKQPGDWRKVNVHGFALRRRVYEEAGGLPHRYGGFAEMLLAAALRDRGVRLGFAGSAVVQHHYRSPFSDTRRLVDFFVRGESLYRAEHPGPDRVGYTFLPPDLVSLPARKAELWRSLALALGRDGASRSLLVQALQRGYGPLVLGGYWDLAHAVWSRWCARWRYLLWTWNSPRRARAYRDWVDRAHRVSRIRFLLDQVGPVSSSGAARNLTAVDFSDHDVVGFHPPELFEGEAFRWSEAAAAVRLAVPAEATALRLQTRDLRHEPLEALGLRVFLNGRRIPEANVTMENGTVCVSLAGCHLSPAPTQILALTCQPLRPWEHGVPDQRELGLSIFGIDFAVHDRAAAERPYSTAAGHR